MASPFSVFRKNRKLFLAILTILAMFAFVFTPLFDKVGGRGRPQDPVAVSSSYGELRESDLYQLRNQHNRVLNVMADVIQAVGVPPAYARSYAERMLGSANDEAVVETWLLAQYAEKMGMVVSNETINEFLKTVTQNRVRPEDFRAIFKRAGTTDLYFFNALRSEILASQLKSSFQWSAAPVTPAQRWDYFSRIKKEASIEAVAVPVAQYVDRIPDPSDAELKAFFEEHKDKYARPTSPTPGFHEPQRIAAQYVKADYGKILASVTDEEVAAHYEKNKAEYEQYEKSAAGQTPGSQAQPAGTDASQTPASTQPAESTQPAATETPKATEQPKEEPKEQPKTEQPKATEEKKEEKPEGTSSTQQRSPFMLTAYTEEKPAEAAPAAGASDAKPAETATPAPATPAPSAPAPATPAPAETQPAAAASADATPPATPAPAAQAPAAQAPEAQTQAAPENAPKADEKPAAPAGPSPLVKSIIRRRIVDEKVQKIFDGIRDRVEQYRTARSKYEAAKNKGVKAEEPQKLDLQTLASSDVLSSGETGLISAYEAQRTDLGRSLVNRRQPVWMFAFGSLSNYRPDVSQDRDNNYFLFWKTEEQKERVPTFDEAGMRDQVLHAWKMVKARTLAVEEAGKLAEEARKAGKPLKEVFAGRDDLKVALPEAFSWLTFGQVPLGSAPGAVRLSEINGIDTAGTEFMRTVFGLKPNEIGVAKNAPETVAYVVQLTATTPADDVLWTMFQTDDFTKYAPAAQEDQQELYTAWINGIKKSAGLKWTPGRDAAKSAAGNQPSMPIESDDF